MSNQRRRHEAAALGVLRKVSKECESRISRSWRTHRLPEGSATAKAIDYSLRRWDALTRFIDDGDLPADNNWVENQIRPIAMAYS